jgi:16S rRNA (cytosine967-C5)-methyltransferase
MFRRLARTHTDRAGAQRELLAAAARAVRPGGVLVYATCSLEAAENGEQAARFLRAHPAFELDAPAAGVVPAQLLTRDGLVECLPFRDGTDGAFAARLRRRE